MPQPFDAPVVGARATVPEGMSRKGTILLGIQSYVTLLFTVYVVLRV